jgi:hypothetical protein
MSVLNTMKKMIEIAKKGSDELVDLHDNFYPNYVDGVVEYRNVILNYIRDNIEEIISASEVTQSISTNNQNCLVGGGEVDSETIMLWEDENSTSYIKLKRGWSGLECSWDWKIVGAYYGTLFSY